MNAKLISNDLLGLTARWTAAARTLESKRADPLFNDPWAAVLAGEQGAAWMARRTEESCLPMILRTRFFDDFLKKITGQDNIRQVVLLAAGLDTRAFRLSWPEGTSVFELDQPAVLQYKKKIMDSGSVQATCMRQTIPTDLTQPFGALLKAAGFNPQMPSGWLLEGFLFYLPAEAITRIIDQVTLLSEAGSWLGLDIVNQAVLSSPWTKAWVDMQAQAGAPWIGTLEDPGQFLASRGWSAVLTQPGQPDASYGRWTMPVIPVNRTDLPHNWYITAQKVDFP
jgi:methyltransferase (TIGR00027 family)